MGRELQGKGGRLAFLWKPPTQSSRFRTCEWQQEGWTVCRHRQLRAVIEDCLTPAERHSWFSAGTEGGFRLGRGGLERAVASVAQRLVYDIDDAVFLEGASRRGPKRAARAASLLEAADLVIVGNEYLADQVRTRAASVTVVPSCVEPSDYVSSSSNEQEGPVVLGWIGSRTTERYLLPLMPTLAVLQRRYGVTVRLISAGPFADGSDGRVCC